MDQKSINAELFANLEALHRRQDQAETEMAMIYQKQRERDAAFAEVLKELIHAVSNLGDRINGRAS